MGVAPLGRGHIDFADFCQLPARHSVAKSFDDGRDGAEGWMRAE